MSSAIDFQNSEDLAFFGKISASISHELKNILAIISETAGLLHDLTELATKGKDVELEMLKTCCQDIEDEIRRGFDTVKQMNTFAHSVDDALKSTNLADVINLTINLAGYLSFASKVRFDLQQDSPPMIFTCPFRLQNLIYQTLVYAFESAGTDGEIRVSVHQEPDGSARITFSNLGSESSRVFPSDMTKKIAESIGADIRFADDYLGIDILVSQLNQKRD
jgi:signal transduction histidine kinase